MHGFVFYPDGGARPQREYCGSGIHGYRWELEAGTRSIGHSTHTTTPFGYSEKNKAKEWLAKTLKGKEPVELADQIEVLKDNLDAKVTVVEFYDASAPNAFGGTNNSAELEGAIACMRFILSLPDADKAASIVLRQDAMYVVEGINGRVDTWAARNWISPSNGQVMPNKDLWVEMRGLLAELSERGIKFRIDHVEAHSTDIGNISADRLATVGVFKCREEKRTERLEVVEFKRSPAEGYWAGGLEFRHPFMSMRYCFAHSNSNDNTVGEYILSTQGKEVSLNGKRTSDDGVCVVRCAPIGLIDSIFEKQQSIPREIDYPFQIDLNSVYGKAFQYLNLYGGQFLHRKHDHARHLFLGDDIVTEENHPPFLVSNIFDNGRVLSDFLDNYKDSDAPTLSLTDITDTLYDTVEKKVKVKKGEEPRTEQNTVLKSEIGAGFSKHTVTVGYKSEGETKTAEIALRVGVDFPERNTLKRIEETKPRVYVLTNWLGGAFMFATVIESGVDLGIWCGINSSLRVIGAPAKAK